MGSAPSSVPLTRIAIGRTFQAATIAEWVTLTIMPLAALFVWYYWGGNHPLDDAYISFQYARNLADGHGLVWNLGEQPTQGYTNFLMVVLVSLGLKLGFTAELWSFVVNAAGVLLTVVSLRVATGSLFPGNPLGRIFPPLAVALMPTMLLNQMTGLETNLWVGLTFAAAACATRLYQTRDSAYVVGLAVFSALACLTRPESVLLTGLHVFFAFVAIPPMRRAVLIAGGALGVLGGLYAAWLVHYFGTLLPNPFYVKVDGGTNGLIYVAAFVIEHVANPLIIAGYVGVRVACKGRTVGLLPYAVGLALLPVYALTNPLVGEHYRFLHPATCLLTFAAALGLVYLASGLARFLNRRLPLPQATFLVWGAGAICGLVLFFGTPMRLSAERLALGPSTSLPLPPLSRTAVALSSVPGIESVVIAYGDAGEMPYRSGAQLLDVVGLNETTIAHEGKTRGADWVVSYVLGRSPDLIAFYSYPDGTIFNEGHGIIGTAYSDLYRQRVFQEEYSYIGGVKYAPIYNVHVHWFVRDSSSHADVLRLAIGGVADFTTYTLKP